MTGKFAETASCRLDELETLSKQCQDKLDAFFLQHEEQQQCVNSLSEQVLCLEAACAKSNAMLGMMLGGPCGHFPPQLEPRVGSKHDEEQQQQAGFDDEAGTERSCPENREQKERFDISTARCEQRLDEVEKTVRETKITLDELHEHQQRANSLSEQMFSMEARCAKANAMLGMMLTGSCEQLPHDFEHSIHAQHESKDESQEKHQQQEQTASASDPTSMDGKASSRIEALMDMCEQRLSQLECSSQEYRNKLNEVSVRSEKTGQRVNMLTAMCERRFSQVETGILKDQGKHDEHVDPHGTHREEAETFCKQALPHQTEPGTAGPCIENLAKMCEQRLSQLESSSQEHGDKLEQLGICYKEHEQRSNLLSTQVQSVETGGARTSITLEAFIGSCSGRIGQLESCIQQHRDRLDKLGIQHEKHRQETTALSAQALSMEAQEFKQDQHVTKSLSEQTSPYTANSLNVEALTEMWEQRISQLENCKQEQDRRLSDVDSNSSLAETAIMPDSVEKTMFIWKKELFSALGSFRCEVEKVQQLVSNSQAMMEDARRGQKEQPDAQPSPPATPAGAAADLALSASLLGGVEATPVSPAAHLVFASPEQVSLISGLHSPEFSTPQHFCLNSSRNIVGLQDDDSTYCDLTPRSASQMTAAEHTYMADNTPASPPDWDSHFGVSEQQLQLLRRRFREDGRCSHSSHVDVHAEGRRHDNEMAGVGSRLKAAIDKAFVSGHPESDGIENSHGSSDCGDSVQHVEESHNMCAEALSKKFEGADLKHGGLTKSGRRVPQLTSMRGCLQGPLQQPGSLKEGAEDEPSSPGQTPRPMSCTLTL